MNKIKNLLKSIHDEYITNEDFYSGFVIGVIFCEIIGALALFVLDIIDFKLLIVAFLQVILVKVVARF